MDHSIQAVKKLRKRLGLSQFRLGQLAQVSRNRISQAECRYSCLTGQELAKLKGVLNRVRVTSNPTYKMERNYL